MQVVADCQPVPLVPHSDHCLMLHVPELDLAAPQHGVGAVPVVVVAHAAVVDHGREVGMVVVVRTVMVAVGVGNDGQATEQVLRAKHLAIRHPVLRIPGDNNYKLRTLVRWSIKGR